MSRAFVIKGTWFDVEEGDYRATIDVEGFTSGLKRWGGTWYLTSGVGARWPTPQQASAQIQAALNEVVRMMEGVEE